MHECIWLPEAGYAGTDLPLALVDGVDTATPALYHVHADHLGRPVKATNAAKASVWDAVWTPWGAPHSLTGSLALDARLPGQWFQLEAGLHYNWHRHYDPTLGRYTQPDPLGFVDGPSVYAYAGSNPQFYIDSEGLMRGARRTIIRRYNPNALQYPRPGEPRGGTYTLRDPAGNVCRAGRTNDLARREREHRRNFPELDFRPELRTDNYNQQRGHEQLLYQRFNPPLNKIQPISPRNPNRSLYLNSVK